MEQFKIKFAKNFLTKEQIKEREKFRPFAGSILKEHAKDYFKLEKDSPYMLAVYEVNPEKKNKILGIVHKNNTCRIQTVSKKNNQVPSILFAVILSYLF